MELPVVILGGRKVVARCAVVLLLASCARGGTGTLDTTPSRLNETSTPQSFRSDASGSNPSGAMGDIALSESAALIPVAANTTTTNLNPGDKRLPQLDLVTGASGSGQEFTQLLIHSDIEPAAVTTQTLSNPSRFVVDLPRSISSKPANRTYAANGSSLVSQVRIGSSASNTRIVFDLPEGKTVTPSFETDNGALKVTLNGSTLAANNMADSEAMRAAPAPEMIEQAAQKPVTNTASTTSAELKPTVNGIKLEETGPQTNELVLSMDSAGFYTLKRTAPSEYVLRLEDATLTERANQTLVAAANSGKIRSVRPVVDGNDVLLRIFSAPDTALKAESKGGNIVVAATTLAHELGADTRAQLAPEKTEKPGTSEVLKADSTTTAATKKVEGGKAEVKTEGDAPAKAGTDSELNALLQDQQYSGRLISLDLQDTDIDNALRIIAEVSNLNIVTTEDVQGKVTLRLIDVPWDQALDVILKINALGKVQEGNVVRIAPLEKLRAERESLKQAKQAEEQLEELKVRYLRISYARAAELKPLTETVLTERGSVAYDERSNQLIIKDTKAGLGRVVELVKKLDLRTPQVLLETQIVESKRGFQRQLGAKLGYNFSQSPATGNGTGYNFPNSIVGAANSNNLNTLNPAAAPGVFNIVFGSADGSKNLDVTLAAAENEGLAKIISRPSVATTNNKQATIKSVTKLRVKAPSGGTQVSVGQGGQTGGSPVATETIEAGITLDVTPQASPDYYVLLDINAKSSTFDTTTSVDGIPSEVERSATSTILVSSGQTFVMGGIYKITENNTLNGVPFMKDIPVLGHLFRFSDTDNTDEELLFFITPRIIEGSFDDAAMKAAM